MVLVSSRWRANDAAVPAQVSGKTAAARDGAANHSRRPLSMAGPGRTLRNSPRAHERAATPALTVLAKRKPLKS